MSRDSLTTVVIFLHALHIDSKTLLCVIYNIRIFCSPFKGLALVFVSWVGSAVNTRGVLTFAV